MVLLKNIPSPKMGDSWFIHRISSLNCVIYYNYDLDAIF
jgi:hypothetical protein